MEKEPYTSGMPLQLLKELMKELEAICEIEADLLDKPNEIPMWKYPFMIRRITTALIKLYQTVGIDTPEDY